MLRTEKEQRVAIINQLVNHYNIISNCRMMNWDDIIYCSQNDVEIGSHTYNHDSLISIKKSINYDIEIHRSITEISEKIKKNVSILALPNGKYSNEVLEYVNCTEIKFLLLVDDKINKSITDPNLNLVSRIGLADDSPWESILRMELFHSKLKKIV